MSRASEWIKALGNVLRHFGIDDFNVVHGGKHQALVFLLEGREKKHWIPTSPSDNYRGLKNSEAQLRRVIRQRSNLSINYGEVLQ